MARSESRTKTSIWSDPDFLALSGRAQRMYWMLYSQPTITLCGVVPMTVGRWAKSAVDETRETVESALCELEGARYIVVDWDTEEVFVRTFVRHDGVLKNPKAMLGAEAAIPGIISPRIRALVEATLGRGPDGGGPKGVSPTDDTGPNGPPKGYAIAHPNGHVVADRDPIGKGTGTASAENRRTDDATAGEYPICDRGDPIGIPHRIPHGMPSARARARTPSPSPSPTPSPGGIPSNAEPTGTSPGADVGKADADAKGEAKAEPGPEPDPEWDLSGMRPRDRAVVERQMARARAGRAHLAVVPDTPDAPDPPPPPVDRHRQLVDRWVAVTGQHRQRAAADTVVAHLLAHLDWRIVDEQIGWCADQGGAIDNPRYLLATCRNHARSAGHDMPDLPRATRPRTVGGGDPGAA